MFLTNGASQLAPFEAAVQPGQNPWGQENLQNKLHLYLKLCIFMLDPSDDLPVLAHRIGKFGGRCEEQPTNIVLAHNMHFSSRVFLKKLRLSVRQNGR